MQLRSEQPGKVLIVGAGPGAPDLVTLRGLRALHAADVVFYDALVNADLLSEVPEHAERIFVGKRCGRHSVEQLDINRMIIVAARAGKTVVRLKGGDPLVFGRGGEEALACDEAGIPFELVPGVSSAIGAASSAGIPLTHRGLSSSVAFVTAHNCGNDCRGPDLVKLAQSVDTLVIFMGGARLGSIGESLIGGGLPKNLAAAVVSQATLPTQRTILGTLETIAEQASHARLPAPMLIIIGAVTNLSPILNRCEHPQPIGRLAVPSPTQDSSLETYRCAT